MTTKTAKTTNAAKAAKPAAKSSAAKPAAKSSAAKPAKPAAKGSAAKTARPAAKSGPAKTAKAAAKPAKVAAKPAATAKTPARAAAPAARSRASGGRSTRTARSAASTKGTAAAATQGADTEADLLQAVRPLIRVRQMRQFSTRRVTRAELDAITEVARWSGSSRNEQACRFIALRKAETIQEIAEMGLPQTRGLPTATAAIAIVEPDEPERGNARAFDNGRAAERILIAANLLGLAGGISRVRADVREPINQRLGLPANRSVRTIVALGHPTAEALVPKSAPGKARLPREQVVFEEGWPSGE